MKVIGTIAFEIDDELFAEHDGDRTPPPNDVNDWDFRDLFRAQEQGLLGDDGDLEIVRVG